MRNSLFSGSSVEDGVLQRRLDAASESKADAGAGEGGGTGDSGIMDETDLMFDFDDLDETTQDVDLETIDADLARFRKHPFVSEALGKGIDLSSYADDLSRQLREVEAASVDDYVREAGSFAQLYREVTASEGALGRLQQLLKGFKSNLEGIGAEISKLKQETSSKKNGLANRRAVGSRLQAFLDKVGVSAEMIVSICDGPVDEAFVDDVRALSDKLTFAAAHGRTAPPCEDDASDAAGRPAQDPLADIGVDPFETVAGRDALPQLEGLRTRAAVRCRTHLLQCFEELRRPKTNPQAFQAHVLLKHRALMAFLLAHAPDVAAEVVAAYVCLWGKSLQALVRSYHAGLARFCAPVATAGDTVVPGEGRPTRSFLFAAKPSRDPFNTRSLALLNRTQVLRRANDPPDQVHVVVAAGRPLAYEEIFRSTQRHLVELAATEHAFCLAFFGRAAGAHAYAQVMAQPVSAALEALEEHLYSSHDAIGLLLMIQLTYLHRITAVEGLAVASGAEGDRIEAAAAAAAEGASSSAPDEEEEARQRARDRGELDVAAEAVGVTEAGRDVHAAATASSSSSSSSSPSSASMDIGSTAHSAASPAAARSRALPVMESFFDRVTMLLWPRLKATLDAHTRSLHEADSARLGTVSLEPHFVTLRYTELAASILSLLRSLVRMGATGDDMLRHNMAVMRGEYEALLARLASRHAAKEVRIAFLHNSSRRSADMLRERRAPEDELTHFVEAASEQAELFANEALAAHFGRMVALVRRVELDMAGKALRRGLVEGDDAEDALEGAPRGKSGELLLPADLRPEMDLAEAEAIVRDFTGSWSTALGRLNDAVQRLVGAVDAAGALEVLKQTAFRMLSLYARLLDAIRRAASGTPAFLRDAVSAPVIMREIQTYAKAGQEAAKAATKSGATEELAGSVPTA